MIDPSKIPQFQGDCDELETAASGLGTDATNIKNTGSDIHSTFQGLSAFYQAPEAEQLFASTKTVQTRAESFSEDLTEVGAALSDYATEVRPIAARLTQLQSDARAFVDSVSDDDDWRKDGDKVDEHNGLISDVNGAVAQLMEAERRAANRINALFGGTQYVADDGSGGSNMYGYNKDLLDQAEVPWGTPEERDKPWWQDTWDGVKGFVWDGLIVDGVWGTLTGLYGLVAFWDWETFKGSWQGIYTLATFNVYAGALALMPEEWADKMPQWGIWSREHGQASLEAWTNFGKAFVAWDTWEDDPARAAGLLTFNVLTLGVAELKVGNAGQAGRLSSALRTAGTVGRVIDPMTYLGRAGRFVLPTVDDLARSLNFTVPDIAISGLDDLRLPEGTVELPDGTFRLPDGTVQLPDGTVHLPDADGLVRIPDGTVHLPDGTVRLPDGTTHLPDGSTRLPDGSTHLPDGTVQLPDGTTRFPDGSVQTPDGSVHAPDADGSVRLPDGTTHLPDGSVRLPDGEVRLPDGSIRTPDGSVHLPDADGAVRLPDGTVHRPDGSVRLPDGSTRLPDGSVDLPDGSVRFPDGSVRLPDGEVRLPDGTTHSPGRGGQVRLPDGTIHFRDGDVRLPDGSVRTPDGHIHLPDADGNVRVPDGRVFQPDGTVRPPDFDDWEAARHRGAYDNDAYQQAVKDLDPETINDVGYGPNDPPAVPDEYADLPVERLSSGESRAAWNHDSPGWTEALRNPRPNTVYIVDDRFLYVTDDAGRVSHAEGWLDYDWRNSSEYAYRRSPDQGDVGNYYYQGYRGPDGTLYRGDAGGHLFGAKFHGPGERINLVPVEAGLNGKGLDTWGEMEGVWEHARGGDMRDGVAPRPVHVTIELDYGDVSRRPDLLSVSYRIGDGPVEVRAFENDVPRGFTPDHDRVPDSLLRSDPNLANVGAGSTPPPLHNSADAPAPGGGLDAPPRDPGPDEPPPVGGGAGGDVPPDRGGGGGGLPPSGGDDLPPGGGDTPSGGGGDTPSGNDGPSGAGGADDVTAPGDGSGDMGPSADGGSGGAGDADPGTHDATPPAYIDPDGGWHWKGLDLTPEQNAIADAGLRDRAAAYDDITGDLRQLEGQLDGARLVGPDEGFSLKGEDRFKEKLAKWIQEFPDKSPQVLADQIHDGIRYTYELRTGNYTQQVEDILQQMRDLNYEPVELKNYWTNPHNDYQGINSTWRDPRTGQLFELQFHTEESLATKELTHDYYERIENPQTPPAEVERLKQEQRELFRQIPLPDGVDQILNVRKRP